MRIIEFFLSGVCHQLPEHSLHLAGRPLPLCARCTGTFLGVGVGMLVLWALGHGRRSLLPPWRAVPVLAVPVAVWAVDGVNSFVEWVIGRGPLYPPHNALRLATGLGLGLAIAAVLYPTFHYAMWRTSPGRTPADRVLARPAEFAWMVGAGAAVGAGILAWGGAPYALVAALAAGAVAVTLTIVNGSLVALVVRAEGAATTWPGVLPYLGAGLALGLVETGALALVRRWLGM